MTLVVALVLAAAIGLPHGLPLERTRPAIAASIWLSALALRALSTVFIALFVIFFVRVNDVFGVVTHWCWHAVIPFVAKHLSLNGHSLGDAATVVPAIVLAVSLLSVAVGLRRAGRSVRRLLNRSSLGHGPGGSVIVGGADVVLAATGLTRPQVLVSAGALTALSVDELAAGLDHERGHIARRHHAVLVVAELLRALARFVPGSRWAMGELRFHLERDADHWALRHRNDPLALASAICKAAGAQPSVATASLGGGSTTRRVRQLLSESPGSTRRPLLPGAVAVAMLSLTLTLAALVPSATAAGVHELRAHHDSPAC